MDTAINDATLKRAGNIYQYLIALRDCYEFEDGELLQIEINGDVGIITADGTKHYHAGEVPKDGDILIYDFKNQDNDYYPIGGTHHYFYGGNKND